MMRITLIEWLILFLIVGFMASIFLPNMARDVDTNVQQEVEVDIR